MTADPQASAPVGRRAGASADRFSWSSLAGESHGGDSINPVTPAGRSEPGGTLTSHRREFGLAGPGEPGQSVGAQPPPGQPQKPRGPRWYRRPRWLAVLAALVLVAAGLGTELA